jgi:2-iminobutanoate/2-iminopropanoate deaminase
VKTVNAPDFAVPVAPLSHAVVEDGFVFCSGQIPQDQQGSMVTGSITELTERVLANLSAVLQASGSGLDAVVRTNVYLVDLADFQEMNAAYARFVTHAPARTCIQVAALPLGARVEIDCIARVR